MFVHLLPHSRVFFLTLLQTLYFSSNCLEWLKCCSLLNTSQHSSTLPSGSRSIGQVQHFWVEPERSFWRRKSLFLLQLKWEVRSTSTSTYIANAMLKNNIVGRINNYPGPFKYFWSFQFFLGPAINFQTSVGQSSQISTAVFYQNSSWSFWHTDAHTKQCFLCSFFLLQISCDYIWQLRQVLLVVCVCTYVCIAFDATCWNHSTYAGKSSNDRIAQIVQHMLKEKAQHEGWKWKGCLRRNCVAVWPNLAEPSWVSRSQIYLLTALIIGCPHLHHQYHCHDHEHH